MLARRRRDKVDLMFECRGNVYDEMPRKMKVRIADLCIFPVEVRHAELKSLTAAYHAESLRRVINVSHNNDEAWNNHQHESY